MECSCIHCGSINVVIKENKMHHSLECVDCGKWIKWVKAKDIKELKKIIEGNKNKSVISNECKVELLKALIPIINEADDLDLGTLKYELNDIISMIVDNEIKFAGLGIRVRR